MLAAILIAAASLPQIPFEKYQLPNGLTVILSEDHRAPVIGVDLWYHVGAVNERKGRSGFAHLFEHLMFQGSKHLNGDERTVFAMLDRNGATNLNGTTDWDRTNYFETMPAEERSRRSLARGALLFRWVALGWMAVLAASQSDGLRNAPLAWASVGAAGAWTAWLTVSGRKWSWRVLGFDLVLCCWLVVASGFVVPEGAVGTRAFFATYYAPDNASIAIVGDFRPADVKPLVEKYFGPIPRGPQAPPVTAKTQPHTGEVRETLRDQVQLAKVLIGYIGPKPLENPAIGPLVRILAGGKSSRLYHDLVYEKKIAQDVSANWDPSMQLGGIVEITATVQVGHTPEEVEAALTEEVRRLREAPATVEELERERDGRGDVRASARQGPRCHRFQPHEKQSAAAPR